MKKGDHCVPMCNTCGAYRKVMKKEFPTPNCKHKHTCTILQRELTQAERQTSPQDCPRRDTKYGFGGWVEARRKYLEEFGSAFIDDIRKTKAAEREELKRREDEAKAKLWGGIGGGKYPRDSV